MSTHLAELCKGSTADSDSVCLGSNPSSAAKNKRPLTPSGLLFLNAEQVEPSFVFAKQMRIGCVNERKALGACSYKPSEVLFRKKKPPSSADDVRTVLDWRDILKQTNLYLIFFIFCYTMYLEKPMKETKNEKKLWC